MDFLSSVSLYVSYNPDKIIQPFSNRLIECFLDFVLVCLGILLIFEGSFQTQILKICFKFDIFPLTFD